MRLLFAAALLAATCQHPDPTGTGPVPPPDPVTDFPPDGGDDAGTPAPTPDPVPAPAPDSTCSAVLDHLRDLECPPAGDSDAFLIKCAGFSAGALSCLLATDTCAIARACLEK